MWHRQWEIADVTSAIGKAQCRMGNVNPSANRHWRLPIADPPFAMAHCRPAICHCPLPIRHLPLPIAGTTLPITDLTLPMNRNHEPFPTNGV
jgi:hypothetical protein